MRDKYCNECDYFLENHPGSTYGWCRRYPPAILSNDRCQMPKVGDCLACGELKEKTESLNAGE